MRVNFQFCQPDNTILNAGSINRGLNRDKQGEEVQSGNGMRRDSVTISPQGKMMKMIENLTKQKEAIIENRNELVSKTLEKGGNMETIKEQMEVYATQLEEIDKQISDIYAQQAKAAVEKDDEKKSDQSNENKTEEQLSTEHLTNLANVTEDIKNAEKISSTQGQFEGEARVKKAEAHMGQLYVERLESRGLDGRTNVKDLIATAKQSIKSKKAVASELMGKAAAINTNHGEKLNEIVAKLEDSQKAVVKADGADETDAGTEAGAVSAQAAVAE